jgi:ABC-type transport system involved in cytochrome bd biosynthesis fused ATPase/permease subunit
MGLLAPVVAGRTTIVITHAAAVAAAADHVISLDRGHSGGHAPLSAAERAG